MTLTEYQRCFDGADKVATRAQCFAAARYAVRLARLLPFHRDDLLCDVAWLRARAKKRAT